jgi:hypothetical protein
MNSIPQHAVTKGYEKSEYFRAHARALSRVVVRKPDWSGVENIARIPFEDPASGVPLVVEAYTRRPKTAIVDEWHHGSLGLYRDAVYSRRRLLGKAA